MDFGRAKERLRGCYITVPTMFRDPDLELDLDATKRNVHFLLERGIDARYGTLLAGGAAGDFSTMTFEERLQIVDAVVEAADGRVSVAMGAQTTSTLELKRLARAARTSATPRAISTPTSPRRRPPRTSASSSTTPFGPAGRYPSPWSGG